MKPIIGITAGFLFEENKHYLRDFYIKAVENFGAIPIILPSVENSSVRRIFDLVDGIIFSGGADIDPSFYGQSPLKGLGVVNPNRDKFELFLAKMALTSDKPVLGICRGMQVLCVAAGGQIYQDLQGITQNEHNQNAPFDFPFHEVKIVEDSFLYEIVGKEKIKVNSFHHQGIKYSGFSLKTVAISDDGLIEAVESVEEDKFILGVQWHPECSWYSDRNSQKIFQAFIERASE